MKTKSILKNMALCISLTFPLFVVAEEVTFKPSPIGKSQYIDSTLTKRLYIYASPKIAELEAEHFKNLYDSLLRKGFSKKEAMQIVVSQGSLLSSEK